MFDALFLRQVWEGNETMLTELAPTRRRSAARGCTTSCSTRARGRGSITTSRSSTGAPPKPPQANFYPAGATKAEVEAWIDGLPGGRRRAPPASSPPSAAAPDGKFVAVPYSLEYQGELARVAALLREAAALTDAADAQEVTSRRAPRRS